MIIEKKEKLVPALRFGEFEGEWKTKQLGEIATFYKGKGIAKADIDIDGVLECIRYGELYTHYNEVIYTIRSRTNLDANKLVISEYNDVIIPASGEAAIDIATASCVLKKGVALSGDLNIVRTPLNGVFLSYYMNNRKKLNIARLAQGISVVHLYSKQLKTLKLNIPIDEEQQKIANFLSSVDKKNEQLRQKVRLLEDYKKGVMQQIFSQQIRFKDEDGKAFPDWEETTLNQYLKESKILGDKGDEAKKLTVKLWGRGVYKKEEKTIGSRNTQYYIRKSGQLIYSKLDFLNCAFGKIPLDLDGYQSTLDLPCFDIIETINIDFLLEKIKQRTFYKKYGDIANGSRKAKRIHPKDFLNFPLKIPSINEQNKIANFLSSIDDKIQQSQQQLEQAQQFKKGLLQQLFV